MSGMPLTEGRPFNFDAADYVGSAPPRKMPTGISALDSIVEGGLPTGSTVLLLEDNGAGAREYVYTAAAKLTLAKRAREGRIAVAQDFILGRECRDSALPRHIAYLTFSRSRDTILQEFQASFNTWYYDAFVQNTVFRDFSGAYFRDTPVPAAWTATENPFEGRTSLLEGMIAFLEENARENVVVVDSLTDLVETPAVNLRDLVTAVKGIQRESKLWDGIVYLLLARGIADTSVERSLIDAVDGCISFEWHPYLKSSKRQRYMHFDKFTSVLPHLSEKKIARFPVRVMAREGLVVDYLERIA